MWRAMLAARAALPPSTIRRRESDTISPSRSLWKATPWLNSRATCGHSCRSCDCHSPSLANGLKSLDRRKCPTTLSAIATRCFAIGLRMTSARGARVWGRGAATHFPSACDNWCRSVRLGHETTSFGFFWNDAVAGNARPLPHRSKTAVVQEPSASPAQGSLGSRAHARQEHGSCRVRAARSVHRPHQMRQPRAR